MAADGGLLEREAELARVAEMVARAAEGEGGVLVVEGSAGLGKSSLLAAAIATGEAAGLRVLRARATELERQFPFGLVRQLFAAVVQDPGAAPLLSGAGRFALPALTLEGERPQLDTVLHGLHWFTAGLSGQQPLLLVMDDLHWSDVESLEFVRYLAARTDGLPVAVLAGARTGPGEGEQILRRLAGQQRVSTLALRPLSEDGVASLLETLYGTEPTPRFAAACAAATAGNPFVVRELSLTLLADGVRPDDEGAAAVPASRPDSVLAWSTSRVAALSDDAAAVAVAVAVLGPSASPAAVRLLAGLPAERALAAAEELVAAEVLVDEVPLRFAHPLLRAAVYDGLSAIRRSQLHADAARVLDEHSRPAEEIGAQLLRAAPEGSTWAAERLLQAARDAADRGATAACATLVRRALDEPAVAGTRLAALRLLGERLGLVGDAGAIAPLTEAHRLAEDPQERITIAVQLAVALTVNVQVEQAIALLDRTIAEIGPDRPELTGSLEAQRAVAGRLHPGFYAQTSARLREVGEAAGPDGPVSPDLRGTLAVELTMRGATAAEAAALVEPPLAGLTGLDTQLTFYDSVYVAVATGQLELAAAAVDLRVAEAQSRALNFELVMGLMRRATLRLHLGDVAAAEVDAQEAFERCPSRLLAMIASHLIEILVERDDIPGAERVLERAHGLGELWSNVIHNLLLFERGRLRLASGETAAGLADLEEVSERERPMRRDVPAWMPWRSAMAVALSRTDPERAQALAAEELALARHWGAPRPVGVALTALGQAQPGEEGFATLREAVTTLEGAAAVVEVARAQLALGRALRHAGQRREARPWLREAIDGAVRCGALRIARDAQEQLAATGARPRNLMIMGRDALTATERRVATMAGDGLTSRQIAEALFVSVRTVDNHLGRVYRKLEVGGRAQLAEALRSPTG